MQESTFHYTATMGIVKQVTFIAAELATVVLRILRFGAIDACFYFADDSVECGDPGLCLDEFGVHLLCTPSVFPEGGVGHFLNEPLLV